MIGQYLAIFLIITKTTTSFITTKTNNNNLFFNKNDDSYSYILDDEVYNENERKAAILSDPTITEDSQDYNDFVANDDVDDYEDEDEATIFREKKLSKTYCEEVKHGPFLLETDNHHILPRLYHNITCKPVSRERVLHNRSASGNILVHFCKVRNNRCETMEREISIFKKRNGQSCWAHETRTVQVGCDCS